jgi:hypothetical protein
MTDLEIVIKRWRQDAEALARNGAPERAAVLVRCADEASASAEEWLTWLPEADARLRSGYSLPRMRALFRELQPRGHARQVGPAKRIYRAAVIPRRQAILDAAAEGRQVARAMRRAG